MIEMGGPNRSGDGRAQTPSPAAVAASDAALVGVSGPSREQPGKGSPSQVNIGQSDSACPELDYSHVDHRALIASVKTPFQQLVSSCWNGLKAAVKFAPCFTFGIVAGVGTHIATALMVPDLPGVTVPEVMPPIVLLPLVGAIGDVVIKTWKSSK